MAHLGTLRDFRFADNADDIRGTKLYGRNDERLGEIDDVIFDHQTGDLRYAVVDTGGWLSSKQFLVPADRIRPREGKDEEYVADLSKREIERFPAYNEDDLKDDEKWSQYESGYRAASGFEETGGVLHQAGGTNILVRDDVPAEGKVPVGRSGQPVKGYKSPIHHQEVGMMDTTPLGVGANQDDKRLAFVPDAIDAGRGDIRDKDTPEVTSTPRQVGECAELARESRPRDIANRETDTMYHTDRGSKLSEVEQTIEGDAIFNTEDIRGRTHQSGNVHDADTPSNATVGGEGTSTVEGRTPNNPDAGQLQEWTRFRETLRRSPL